jgi:16S rRNA (cytidine1402-2'-O)-methyltransferase
VARPDQLPFAGRLEVVATPIGNLGDLSSRAREVLAAADLIAAEDTRRTAQLLSAIGVTGQLISMHDYNEEARIEPLLQQLKAGKVIALVSDAGTPLLSDPGFGLVRAAAAAGIEVRAVPGASAVTAALSIAGLATDRFVFEGFCRCAPQSAGRCLRAWRSKRALWCCSKHRTGSRPRWLTWRAVSAMSGRRWSRAS